MSNYVFVIDTDKQPLNPIHSAEARLLLSQEKSAVFCRYPFTIILKEAKENVEIKPRISNLSLACEVCNIQKGAQSIENFLTNKPDVLKRVLSQAKRPLKDAAAVNSTRWALFNRLKETGLLVSTGSGGQTKFNRVRLNLAKIHWIDAACAGIVDTLQILTKQPLLINTTGHGSRQMCRTDKFGFPYRYVPRIKFVKGFQTGDIVKAIVTSGKKIGTYTGRIAVRSSGSFNIKTIHQLVQGISHKYCHTVHKKDGYSYGFSNPI